jgi:hypothetical protein
MAHSVIASTSSTLREYASRVRAFRYNARLYLFSVIVTGAAMGVFRLLFNFYVLSLGFDEALLGSLVTVSQPDFPGGGSARRLPGRPPGPQALAAPFRRCLQPGYPDHGPAATHAMFYFANVLFGLAQSLAAVTMAPFLMENSGEEERTYLFQLCLRLADGLCLGGQLDGRLPAILGRRLAQCRSHHSSAYGGASVHRRGSIHAVSAASAAAAPPARRARHPHGVCPHHLRPQAPGATLGKLVLPMLVTSIGAGLIMPFMNVFFRQVYHQPDPVIGSIFAWGSLGHGHRPAPGAALGRPHGQRSAL